MQSEEFYGLRALEQQKHSALMTFVRSDPVLLGSWIPGNLFNVLALALRACGFRHVCIGFSGVKVKFWSMSTSYAHLNVLKYMPYVSERYVDHVLIMSLQIS